MSDNRRPRRNDSRRSSGGRGGGSRGGGPGGRRGAAGRGHDGDSRSSGRGRDGRRGPGGPGRGRNERGSGRGGSRSDDRSRSPRRDDRSGGRGRYDRDDRVPQTEAERRAAEVRRRRGPRKPRRDEQELIEERTVEQWIDEGGTREAAEAATQRAGGAPRKERPAPEVAPEVVAAIYDAVGSERGAKLASKLANAAAALERERFGDAKRMVSPLVKELPGVAAVHEINGLINYRQGNWDRAATSLETARSIDLDPALLPVLADTYRAQRRWDALDRVWEELKEISPSHEVMAEGRIIVASALADREEFGPAIEMMLAVSTPPKRVRDHHLRQWYVLADLYDRAGDQVAATRWFRMISANDPAFADVRERLRSLGR